MAHYFTADTHFGDDSIRRFFGRPFRSAHEMDKAILTGCSLIGAEDHLWIVGDFAACETDDLRDRARAAFDALPGHKHLVRGNHDPDWICQNLAWKSVHDLVEIDADGLRMVLCHYPLVTWNGAREGAVQIFGHVHDRWPGAQGQVNAGVDLWEFKPISVAQIELAALTLPPSPILIEIESFSD